MRGYKYSEKPTVEMIRRLLYDPPEAPAVYADTLKVNFTAEATAFL